MDNTEASAQIRTSPPIPPEAISLAGKVATLASLPGACVRVMEMADTADASAREIGEVVTFDPGLSARLLKLVNSAYYALPRKVDSIADAVQIVGTNALRNLALATGAVSAFDGIPNSLVDMETFWNRSVYCALAARELSKIARLRDPECGFVFGLLHAIGQLVMYNIEPAKSLYVLTELRGGQRGRVEEEVFGFSHAEVGAALLTAWKVPESIVVPVRHQMSPGEAGLFSAQAATLNIAIAMAEVFGVGRSEENWSEATMPALTPEIWTMAGLAREVAESVTDEVDALWFEIIEILSPGGTLIY